MNDFDGCYWEIIVGYNGTLERYCRGNYLKRKAKAEARCGRVDGSMEPSVTTAAWREADLSRPTRSPIAELTRRTIGRPDWEGSMDALLHRPFP